MNKSEILDFFMHYLQSYEINKKQKQKKIRYDLFRLAFMFSFLIVKMIRNRRMTRKIML